MNLKTLAPAPPRDVSCAEHSPDSPEQIHGQRILVADNDEFIRQIISSALADDGFAVNAAADGEQAWEALHHEHYDLLVTDNEMPHLAGIKLIERIRQAGMSLPIVIASGSLSTEGVRDYAELQIAAVIPKPFDIREFLTIVRIALRASGEDATTDHGTFYRLQASSQPIR